MSENDQLYRGAERRNGPSLGEYLETRLKLLDQHLDAAMMAMDLRYEQRFQAQQIANQTALVAVEKALQAALGATALAQSKTEDEANRRAAAVVERIDEIAKRIDTLASRFDTLSGQLTGGGSAGSERRAVTTSTVQIVGMVVGLIVLATLLWRAFSGN